MPSENVQVVMNVFGGRLAPGGDADLLELFTNQAVVDRLDDFFEPTAPIEFPTPDGGQLGAMGGPFFGASGLVQAWNEWLSPWESYEIRAVEFEEANDRLLVLGHCVGRMSGSGLEVDTPVAAVYDIERGRVVRLRHFLDQDQARAEAGLA